MANRWPAPDAPRTRCCGTAPDRLGRSDRAAAAVRDARQRRRRRPRSPRAERPSTDDATAFILVVWWCQLEDIIQVVTTQKLHYIYYLLLHCAIQDVRAQIPTAE